MLAARGKAVGRRRALFKGFSVPPPDHVGDAGGLIRLRDLIAHIVIVEVAKFEKRREARRLDRVLSPTQIDQGLAKVKISPEGREPSVPTPTQVDIANAVETALEAFIDGRYLVVIDEIEFRDLD